MVAPDPTTPQEESPSRAAAGWQRVRVAAGHILIVAPLLGALAIAGVVLWPLREPLLLAASLAMLGYPVAFAPVHRLVIRLAPRIDLGIQRQIAAAVATIAVLAAAASPVLLLVVSSLGIEKSLLLLGGLALRNPDDVAQLARIAAERVAAARTMWPDLPFEPTAVAEALRELLLPSRNEALLGYVMRGTGGFLAQALLTFLLLFSFFQHGPRLLAMLLDHTPLDASTRATLEGRFRAVVLRLLADTVVASVLLGLATGLIAWAIGGFNPFVVGFVAAFVNLVPIVGYMFVWLPLASLLWARGQPGAAVILALSCIAASILVQLLRGRAASATRTEGLILNLALFLGVIGGILAFGLKGAIIGPATMVAVMVLSSVLLPLYRVETPTSL